jgi:predicted nuclease with TOPRIM domain
MLQTKLTQAEELHSESLQKSDLEIKDLRHQLVEKTEVLNKTNEEFFSLSTRFDELVQQSSAAVTLWKDRSVTLKKAVQEL